MEFQVRLTRSSEQQIEAIYLWLKDRNPEYADQWFRGLMNLIATLQDKPRRCPLVKENHSTSEEIRQILYGKSRNKYRVIFAIRENTVHIIYVRHSAQSSITFNIVDFE
ncbi:MULTISPECIES: type II toxin-antitoxin system RelE/ParE family toxin [Pseudanabaena]|jgi:plasmid stabilization system protein ParE|uniref:type II toxin-antitoxin system RelE/ParE family toxin n=1 Tax=Pseudanabaena TaxID=1152 RepID=UPI00247A01FE|nr:MULTISPECIES: type II toxin-antitoxin system RelE/ParE family toxin [Pseudanabaena]MEA5488776.1 type II toxin-antitoxin system RelE/ParE family toxin [Pseudanabaena sp. CCNP1317]WGS71268.1 type II toxin-antitoxin system RelE/ParE family toxin [Pseudanabaena galeata CCNP1313]